MGQSDEQRCFDGYLGMEGWIDMYELPEILFFASALLIVGVLAATGWRWRVVAGFGYLACVSAITAMLWGVAMIWLGILLASGLLALLLVVQQYLYSLGDPGVDNRQADEPHVAEDCAQS